MRIIYNNIVDSRRYMADVTGDRIRIGRRADNDIVLNSPYVAEEAIVLHRRQHGWELIACGLESLQVGERELHGGERMLITADEQIKIFPFVLTLDLPNQVQQSKQAQRQLLDEEINRWVGQLHVALLKRVEIRAESSELTDEYLLNLERTLEELSRTQGLMSQSNHQLRTHMAGSAIRSEFLSRLVEQSAEAASSLIGRERHWSRMQTAIPNLEEELASLIESFSHQLELHRLTVISEKIELVEQHFWRLWDEAQRELFRQLIEYLALRYLKKQIKDLMFGYGPLEDLLRTPTISEIMVVDRNHIYIEKSGVLEASGRRFISDEVTETIIQRIVSKVNRRIDRSQPLVDARLSDGSRVNAVIPPLAVSGPCITIRKFPAQRMLIEDLIHKGALTRTVAEFLRAAVLHRCNMLISGGTGTGKTTLLNCLSDFIHDRERIVTIEDTAELQLKKEHVVRMEAKPANIEGAGAYTIRDLVKNALRMRPDRIVVGECRGAEALDMLQAMNTGHDGSLTTIHANEAKDAILRLEVLVQMAADMPVDSIRRQIASAVNVIVQLTRFGDGQRMITQVTEVVDIDPQTGLIRTRDLFVLAEEGGRRQLRPTGRLPTFIGSLVDHKLLNLEEFYL